MGREEDGDEEREGIKDNPHVSGLNTLVGSSAEVGNSGEEHLFYFFFSTGYQW